MQTEGVEWALLPAQALDKSLLVVKVWASFWRFLPFVVTVFSPLRSPDLPMNRSPDLIPSITPVPGNASWRHAVEIFFCVVLLLTLCDYTPPLGQMPADNIFLVESMSYPSALLNFSRQPPAFAVLRVSVPPW